MIENEFEYDFENRMSAPEYTPADEDIENSLRPKQLTVIYICFISYLAFM